MTRRKLAATAAGAVVLRDSATGEPEVLLVHRPAYDDWSLPKGKPEPDEDEVVAAVREVWEETGCEIRLGLPLGTEYYEIAKGTKAARWWRGHLIRDHGRVGDEEVDKVEWMPVSWGRRKLSYDDEKSVLDRALAAEPTSTLLIVRHAKAMDRKNWSGKDQCRPISGRGRRQSRRLARLLSAYGVQEVHSSSSARCVMTLEPYAELAGVTLVTHDELSEEAHAKKAGPVKATMRALAARAASHPDAPVVVCGHRPVLPTMYEAIGANAKPMLTAEVMVLHLDAHGAIVARDSHKSRF